MVYGCRYGSGRHTGEIGSHDDTPYWDWRFETTKAIFNDPSFDQHVFDVRLKRDTWVSDTRYKVSYRVDKEEVVASDLARYAAENPAASAPSLLGHALPAMQALKIDALPAALEQPNGPALFLRFAGTAVAPLRHRIGRARSRTGRQGGFDAGRSGVAH